MTDQRAALEALPYDISSYHERLLHDQRKHQEYKKALALAALLFFAAGLLALHFDLTIGAVALLALAAAFYQMAGRHQLLADMTDAQWSMALLVNTRAPRHEAAE